MILGLIFNKYNEMIPLKIEARKNPQDKASDKKYYLRAIKQDYVDIDDLAYLIANQSTVREPDCLAVLRALELNMRDQLAQGNIVQLGKLGNFQVGVRSNGTAYKKEQHINHIRSIHINYRPAKELKKYLKKINFKLIKDTY